MGVQSVSWLAEPDGSGFMLDEKIKARIREGMEGIKSSLENYRPRGGQNYMIGAVARSFAAGLDEVRPEDGEQILCVHGGTGLGKSLAYILPAAAIAEATGKPIVISSSTVALQEQLIERDLPTFLKAAGFQCQFTLAKGRTRYACEYRLRLLATDMKQVGMFQDDTVIEPIQSIEAVTATVSEMVEKLDKGQWNGDRDSWGAVEEALWARITCNRLGCLGHSCQYFRSCPQIKAREAIKNANIIVVNHNLLLATLQMEDMLDATGSGGGRLLPDPADAFYVLDEAHHLPEKAVDTFAAHHMVMGGWRALTALEGTGHSIVQALGPGRGDKFKDLARNAHSLETSLSELLVFLRGLASLRPSATIPRPTLEFRQGLIPEELVQLGQNISKAAGSILPSLASAQKELLSLAKDDASRATLLQQLAAESGNLMARLLEIDKTWRLMLSNTDNRKAPVAKWIETRPGRGQTDYVVCASPVEAGDDLHRMLWRKARGVVLASATMKTLGKFDDFLRRAGLRGLKKVECLDLPSPFNYAEQGRLVIPPMRSNPKNREAHTKEVLEIVRMAIERHDKEGMLVLFTSRWQMEMVIKGLPRPYRSLILVQGSKTKSQIVAEHKARVDRGRQSIIFGLESFGEGVDLAGKYNSHTIITKLPFMVPDHPVQRALSEWIEQQGGNPFATIAVPDAARKTEQWVGRLVRTESDYGTVTVTDIRLWTTRYGRQMLRGLPPFRLEAMGKEVKVGNH
jgi:ATP-dependent DNA helicase DinG